MTVVLHNGKFSSSRKCYKWMLFCEEHFLKIHMLKSRKFNSIDNLDAIPFRTAFLICVCAPVGPATQSTY